MALQIVRHAILMVLNNFGNALKATVGPMLLVAILVVVGGAVLDLDLAALSPAAMTDPTMPADVPENAGALVLFLLAASVVALFAMSWAAVTWHRFILCEEYPGLVPPLADRPILPYLGKTLLLSLLLVLVMVPVILILSLLMAPLLASGSAVGGLLLTGIISVVFSYLWLRWSLVLPGTAVGKPTGVGESWRQTAPLSGTIVGTSVLLMAINLLVGFVALPFGASPIGTLLSLAGNWFTLMVGLSVLTTLYGHIVEGRTLAA